MTSDQLRDELALLAETAPVAAVPDDTWRRGRRSLARGRALVAGAAAAVVAGVSGAVLVVPEEDPALHAGTTVDAGDLPSRIWNVPEPMYQQHENGEWSSDRVTSDLAVGRGAVAYVTDGGLPVVVDALDGEYHLLDLPDFLGRGLLERTALGEGLALTLSPDGHQLAWAWAGPAPLSDAEPMPSGIRVVDLNSGEVRSIPLSGGRGIVVRSIVWSPDSRWIAWSGQVATYWTDTSYTASGAVAGRIAPGSTESREVPSSRDSAAVHAISDVGQVAVADTNRVVRLDNFPESDPVEPVTTPARIAGSSFPVGASYLGRDLRVLRTQDTSYSYTTHTYPGGRVGDLGLPSGQAMAPLGWIDEQHLLVRTGRPGEDGTAVMTDLAIVGADGALGSEKVGSFEEGVPSVSVATDLIELSRPTVDRPAPDWPWSPERWVLTLGAGVVALLMLLWVVRRRLTFPRN
jgi:hypothetical protein